MRDFFFSLFAVWEDISSLPVVYEQGSLLSNLSGSLPVAVCTRSSLRSVKQGIKID